MNTTNHISFEELADNLTDVFNKVHEEHTPIVVAYATGEKLVIKPLSAARPLRRRGRKRTKADSEAFRAAACSWQDEDVDTFLKNVDERRRHSSRPLVDTD